MASSTPEQPRLPRYPHELQTREKGIAGMILLGVVGTGIAVSQCLKSDDTAENQQETIPEVIQK